MARDNETSRSQPRQRQARGSMMVMIIFLIMFATILQVFLQIPLYVEVESNLEHVRTADSRTNEIPARESMKLVPVALEEAIPSMKMKALLTVPNEHAIVEGFRSYRTTDDEAAFPEWLSSYLAYHQRTRIEYPGSLLFTDPSAPKILVRLCLGLCGGLHDRLGQLHLDLAVAARTGRIYLIQWHKPHPLENFLLPPMSSNSSSRDNAIAIDWRLPFDDPDVPYGDMAAARANPFFDFFDGSDVTKFEDSVKQLMDGGTLYGEKYVNIKFLGDEFGQLWRSQIGHLESKKDGVTSTDWEFVENGIDQVPPWFGHLFRTFFRPSPAVQSILDNTLADLGMVKGRYVAVHCRTRHPKGWPSDGPKPRAESPKFPADRSDIIFDGYERDFTIAVATHAIRCGMAVAAGPENETETIDPQEGEPVYLLTDTFKVTNHMVRSPESPFSSTSTILSPIRHRLLARDDSVTPSIHIDRKRGRPIHEHYGTFVDLYLAVHARCLVYGIGNYGRMASKISSTPCVLQHRKVEWDTHDAPTWFAQPCLSDATGSGGLSFPGRQ